MLPLYNNSNINKIDRYTQDAGISARELIFRAANRFVRWLTDTTELSDNVHIICGPGNNGADGCAVAILLANRGHKVTILIPLMLRLKSTERIYFEDAIRAREDILIIKLKEEKSIKKPSFQTVLIDALFGNGINRPIQGDLSKIIMRFNKVYTRIYGLDVPSGLLGADQKTEVAMRCNNTLAFEFPKLAFFAAENEVFVGGWAFRSIGLQYHAMKDISSSTFLLEKSDLKSMIRERVQFSHKGLMGRALFIASEDNMLGALLLATMACVRSGAGYTIIHGISKDAQGYFNSCPEIVFKNNEITNENYSVKATAIGPGLGNQSINLQLLKDVLDHSNSSLVLDADALNLIGQYSLISKIPKGSILTPHIKEFERVFGPSDSHQKRITKQRAQSSKYGIYIVLKGKYTSISTPEGQIYYNATGNAGLAKGGSGDVLTGIITALLAQSYSPLEACLIGVYIHGSAADLHAEATHEMSMTPLGLISYISPALNSIKLKQEKNET